MSTASDQARRGENGADDEGRGDFRRDHDRVFYSAEFERLEDVTQVATITSSSVRNRLTHSYRVEQIAKSIVLLVDARGEVDEQVVATAALVHDMGHAPFGHTGEEALQKAVTCAHHRTTSITTTAARLDDVERVTEKNGHRASACIGDRQCLLPDGFEGNAQTFRILTLLASNHPLSLNSATSESFGLDLTRRTLRASLKYPSLRGEKPSKPNKWGVYDLDSEAFAWVIDDQSPLKSRAHLASTDLEASIMDIADDIAYAVHDLEDAHKAGLIPFHELEMTPASPTFHKLIAYIRGEAEGGAVSPLHDSPVMKIVTEWDRLQEGGDETPTALGQSDDRGERLYPHLYQLREVLQLSPGSRYTGGVESRQTLASWRSLLIRMFVSDVQTSNGRAVFSSDRISSTIEFLKQLTWYFVIDDPDLSAIREGQEALVISCFNRLFRETSAAWLADPTSEHASWLPEPQHRVSKRLPERLNDYVKVAQAQQKATKALASPRQAVARAVVDYICSLTDSEIYSYSLQLDGAPSHASTWAFNPR